MIRTTTTKTGRTRYQVRRRDAQIPMLAALWVGPEVDRGIVTGTVRVYVSQGSH
jgi:hypothetical protein